MPAVTAPASVRDDLKLAAALGAAVAIAIALLFPYLLRLMPQALEKIPLPLAAIVPLQSLQAALFFFLMAFVGLRMGPRTGLGAPWLNAWIQRTPRPALPWANSIAWGIVAGVLVAVLAVGIDRYLPPPLHTLPSPDAFSGFLASFYGGIGEEVMMRLFLMTLIVWLVARISRRPPSSLTMWSAIALTAIGFGAAHLSAATEIWPLTFLVVLRTIALNAVAGVVFGWLYWRRGLEMAMVAHFSADIVLHVLAPLVGAATT